MAAGRHGDADFEVSRKRDFHYSIEEQAHFRSVDWESGRREDLVQVRRRDFRERVRVRQRDIKEREAVNGYHSSSSTSNSGSSGNSRKQGRISVRMADREPGELSSGSGSDDADVPDSQIRATDILKYENGARSPQGKRRKFSPIVWDREEKQVRGSYRNKTDSPRLPLPPPPPLPQSFKPTPVANMGDDVGLSSLRSNNLAPVDSLGSVASESPADVSPASPHENHWNNDQQIGQLEEEDYYVPTRNISSSRWADEGQDSDEEGMIKKRKKTPVVETMDTRLKTEASSPGFGELTRKDSERARSKSLESDEGRTGQPISRDESLDIDSIKNDFMEVDDEGLKGDVDTDHISGTDSEEENDMSVTPELNVPPQRSINMLQGCRSVDEFERLNKIDEGTYGVVYRVKDKKTGEIVALKKVKMEKEREGFPLTSLREINILLSLHHPSIVDVKEVVVGNVLDNIFMVMEYMEHDLKGLMETMKQPFSQSEVKCLMLQLLEGVKYLHDNWVLHRDLKTSNILLNNRGELKICDFGLSRQYGSPLKPYTHLVVTLWYRAPELLLGAKQYSTAIDMWSLGCIMAELLSKEPLFNGKSEFDQLDKIFRTLGTPNEKIWPGFVKLPGVKVNFVKQPYNKLRDKFPPTSFSGRPTLSEAGMDLLNKLLTYDPDKRITAEDALNHEWFREVPLPKSKDFMPTFPAQHAQDRRSRRIMKSPDPLEEQRRKELQQAELGPVGLFG